MIYEITQGPTLPSGATILILGDGNPALGPMPVDQASQLVDDLSEAIMIAVRPAGAAVLEHCIDLGIPAARSGNGAGQEARP